MTSLTAHDLVLRLGDRDVVRGIQLDIAEPLVLGLLGPNGAGKTSLLRALAGLLEPAAGQVLVGGMDLTSMSGQMRARTIGYLPQERVVNWPLLCREVVMLGRLPHRSVASAPSLADRQAVDRTMRDADCLEFADRPIDELSGGEKNRVLIARVLAQEPRILLADEPADGLDPAHQIRTMRLLREAARAGAIVIVTLHDLTLAARWCDRLVLLEDGRIAAAGAPASVLAPDRLASVYGIKAIASLTGEARYVVPTDLA
ncbi:MAG: ABC transporter ATP-binding protein [Parvibaculaceae bacterium]